jgi:hypothetical protein
MIRMAASLLQSSDFEAKLPDFGVHFPSFLLTAAQLSIAMIFPIKDGESIHDHLSAKVRGTISWRFAMGDLYARMRNLSMFSRNRLRLWDANLARDGYTHSATTVQWQYIGKLRSR